jgi:hypothetical protein
LNNILRGYNKKLSDILNKLTKSKKLNNILKGRNKRLSNILNKLIKSKRLNNILRNSDKSKKKAIYYFKRL